MRPHTFWLLIAFLLLAACSSHQLYETGQNYQRQQCYKLPDPQDMKRCLDVLDRPYEAYERETDELKTLKE